MKKFFEKFKKDSAFYCIVIALVISILLALVSCEYFQFKDYEYHTDGTDYIVYKGDE